MERKTILKINYYRLAFASFIIGLLATGLAYSLKLFTEHLESLVFTHIERAPFLFIFLPSVGITIIYFLRTYLFRGKANKGIKEIYQTIQNRKDELPLFKIPSHFINGLLTVVFGGSTGVEVSTVVASATIGATTHKKAKVAQLWKTELICAGIAAGVATLFNSPIAGCLFAMEVISGKVSKPILISCLVGIISPMVILYLPGEHTLFDIPVSFWKVEALPYLVLLSILAALMSVYFTKIVILIKKKFHAIESHFLRVNIGAMIVGLSIYVFPQLFGDSYHSVHALLSENNPQFSVSFVGLLACLILLKPVVASLTLGAGGDGGVFAPSIVVGAILGVLVATLCNHFFHTDLLVVNFALAGAAAALSAAIHAPLTALFIACNMVPGGYVLFVPLLLCTFVSRYIAQWLCAYTVYTYDDPTRVMFPHARLKQIRQSLPSLYK